MNKKIHSKQKLLDAAFDLFAQNGFHGTSVRDISNKAGVNVSLVSRYYSNKEGLYTACFKTIYEQIHTNKELISALFSQSAFSILIREAYQFAKNNHKALLLIQRSLLFENIASEYAHSILNQFADTLHPSFPSLSKDEVTLALQSILILLSRYALMNPAQKERLIPQQTEEKIVSHLTQFTQHFFSQRTPCSPTNSMPFP